MDLNKNESKIIIYYNASDIFLGSTLLVLVIFFIYNYLSVNLSSETRNNDSCYLMQQNIKPNKLNLPNPNPNPNPKS